MKTVKFQHAGETITFHFAFDSGVYYLITVKFAALSAHGYEKDGGNHPTYEYYSGLLSGRIKDCRFNVDGKAVTLNEALL